MKKLQPFPKLSAKQTLFGFGSVGLISLINILHFSLEFIVLKEVNLPYFFIIFHMIGLPFGAVFTLKFAYKWNNLIAYLSQFTLFTFLLMSLMIFLNPLYIPFGLFGAGFFIGGMSGFSIINGLSSTPEAGDPKVFGRLWSLTMVTTSFFIIIYAVINLQKNFLITIIYFLLILILILFFMLYTKNDFQIITQERLNVTNFFKNKANLPKLGVAFFLGFFIINTYYAAILIFDQLGLVQYLNTFVLILFIIVLITSLPVGIITDTIGRRFTVIIGLAIQALAFLILSFINDPDNIILIVLFIVVLGAGFTFLYIGLEAMMAELPEKLTIRDEHSIFSAFLGMGAAVGVLLGEVFKYLIVTNTAYLTMVLLFVFICATIVIFQVKETLPSRAEKFIKPDNLDEEDLTLYKERKICLVCKGSATGFEVFVCKECGVLYCLKCAKALSTLENVCWACNNPIDESKPIKPLEKAEEDVKEEVKIGKLK